MCSLAGGNKSPGAGQALRFHSLVPSLFSLLCFVSTDALNMPSLSAVPVMRLEDQPRTT